MVEFNRIIANLDRAESYTLGAAERSAKRLDLGFTPTGTNALRVCIDHGAAAILLAMALTAATLEAAGSSDEE
jgi:hypothetical protein